jgi:hypothetical protein
MLQKLQRFGVLCLVRVKLFKFPRSRPDANLARVPGDRLRVGSGVRAQLGGERRHCLRRRLPLLETHSAIVKHLERAARQQNGLNIGDEHRAIARHEMIGGTLRYHLTKQRIFRIARPSGTRRRGTVSMETTDSAAVLFRPRCIIRGNPSFVDV